ncbi:hypothetical protein YC2023_019040 [Brassica napus]
MTLVVLKVSSEDYISYGAVRLISSFFLSFRFSFLFSRWRNRESSTPRRLLDENGEASFGGSRQGRKTTHCLSVAPLQQGKRRHISLSVTDCGKDKRRLLRLRRIDREASVAEDYEAGGGLVDDEDNDGWVVTHGRSKSCLMKMVLRLFDHGETKAYDR